MSFNASGHLGSEDLQKLTTEMLEHTLYCRKCQHFVVEDPEAQEALEQFQVDKSSEEFLQGLA